MLITVPTAASVAVSTLFSADELLQIQQCQGSGKDILTFQNLDGNHVWFEHKRDAAIASSIRIDAHTGTFDFSLDQLSDLHCIASTADNDVRVITR
jgi:hypothetical protein